MAMTMTRTCREFRQHPLDETRFRAVVGYNDQQGSYADVVYYGRRLYDGEQHTFSWVASDGSDEVYVVELLHQAWLRFEAGELKEQRLERAAEEKLHWGDP